MRLTYFILFLFLIIGCKKDDSSPSAPIKTYASELPGTWQGTFSYPFYGVLQLTVDENGNMRGDSVNASSRGITGKWVIDNTGNVTGTGTTAFSRYSSYYVANTTWNLQMNTDKNQLSGTWDIQVPYSDMRNMSMTVSKK